MIEGKSYLHGKKSLDTTSLTPEVTTMEWECDIIVMALEWRLAKRCIFH
jgi:hypothetical protein